MNNNAQSTKEKAIAQTDQMEEGIQSYQMESQKHCFLRTSLSSWISYYTLWIAAYTHYQLMVERNPIKVMAEITYIYDSKGGSRFYAPKRVYLYKFRYRNKIYHDGFPIGDTDNYCGGIGDTLVIQCNKDNPNFSRYYYYDNLDRLITVDEYSEEWEELRKEIPEGKGYLKGLPKRI